MADQVTYTVGKKGSGTFMFDQRVVGAENSVTQAAGATYINTVDENVVKVLENVLDFSDNQYTKILGIANDAIAGVFKTTTDVTDELLTQKEQAENKLAQFLPFVVIGAIVLILIKLKG